jgi:quercetin dioxygenase-like cupin family protein
MQQKSLIWGVRCPLALATLVTTPPLRDAGEKEKRMITEQLNELELAEVWAEEDSEIRFKLAAAISTASPTSSTQLIYFTVEPGESVGRHSHSAEGDHARS